MPEPSLRKLRTFLAVAESGSVSSAARLLRLTQPAISQQLRELERNGRGSAATGVKPHPAMALGSVEAIKTLVGSGLGAAVLPALALRNPPLGTAIRALRPAASRSLGCVLRTEKMLDRGLRLFLAELNRSLKARSNAGTRPG